MGRAPCCDKTKVKRGPWSPEEDSRLIEYVEKHGIGGSWIALPQKAGLKRCGKSCRLRWLNYLRPNIKHGGFTHQEDTIILTLYHNIGSRWSVIASHLPGRTDNDVKNYWNTKLKKKLLAAGKTNYLPTVPPPPPPQTLTMLPCILDSQIPLPGLIDNDVNAYNLALLADGGSTASWSSVNGLSEDEEAFLVEFGSGYDILDAFSFHERFNDPKSLM